MQNFSERIVAWSCRLESHLSRLSERGLVSNVDEMIRTRFWHGLHGSKFKEALRHRFERGESYRDLLTSSRSLEHEFNYVVSNQSSPRDLSSNRKMSNPKTEINLQETSNFQRQLDSLSKQLACMQKDFSAMQTSISNTLRPKSNQANSHPSKPPELRPFNPKSNQANSHPSKTPECFYCHEITHFIRDCPKLKRKNECSISGNVM